MVSKLNRQDSIYGGRKLAAGLTAPGAPTFTKHAVSLLSGSALYKASGRLLSGSAFLQSTRAAYYLALRFYKARGRPIIWLCVFTKHAGGLLSGSAFLQSTRAAYYLALRFYKARGQPII